MSFRAPVPKINSKTGRLYSEPDPTWPTVCAIVGAPCAGKSTLVGNLAQPGDLVVEFDRLNMALSPVGDHEHHDPLKTYTYAAHNAVLRRLRYPSDLRAAFLTALAPTNTQRARYLVGPSASLIVLAVDWDVAHARAEAANRPASWHELIDEYFADYEHPNDDRIEVRKV